MRIFLLVIMMTVLFFGSCKKSTKPQPIIETAHILLDQAPDSAYQILQSIPSPDSLPDAQKADYYLLLTQAEYKLDLPFESDSAIAFSADYYSKRKNKASEAGLAYYLMGYVNEILGEKEKALTTYKEALNYLSPENQPRWRALAYTYIGSLYSKEKLFKQAEENYRKTLPIFEEIKDSFALACNYYNIGEMNACTGYRDSAVLYFTMAQELSQQIGNKYLYHHTIASLGETLAQTEPKKAKALLKQAYEYNNEKHLHSVSYLAYIYAMEQQFDSARYYLHILEQNNSENTNECLITLVQAYLKAKEGKDRQAFLLMEKAYLLNDSIQEEILKNSLFETEKRYDLNRKEAELAQAELMQSRHKAYIWGLTLSLIIFILSASLLLLFLVNRQKRKRIEMSYQQQLLESRLQKEKIQNEQKKELLLEKLKTKVENTIEFNRLMMGLPEEEKLKAFTNKISNQSIISKSEQSLYIDEIDKLFGGKIRQIPLQHINVTDSDLILLALICLGCDITSCSVLLNMNKNTVYTRRKRIKSHIGITAEMDIEEWAEKHILSSLSK